MTREVIESMLTQKPFLPFRLSMTDRSVHEVRDPAWVELGESVLTFYRPDPPAPDGRTWTRMLALRHITSLEILRCDAPTVVGRKD